MPRLSHCKLFLIVLFVAATPAFAAGPRKPTPFTPPDDVDYRTANIQSEGTRLSAELFWPKKPKNEKLPTIILSHGWGGQASLLRADAMAFAQAGYLAVTFDYRGWGSSDGRLIPTGDVPESDGKQPFQVAARELREVVDPLDQTTDLLNVIHWVHGEPLCDTSRIGLWGTSYSGGHVVYAAAVDHRVKAIVSQVPALDSRWVTATADERKKTFTDATRRAQGELGYPPPGVKEVGNLKGAPIREKMIRYAPVDMADQAPGCAMLFIIAEKEELFDNKDHAIKAHDRAKGPKKIITVPGITHYGVYLQAHKTCLDAAIRWFDEELKQ
jgi:dienelactone hydrolase